MTHTIDADTTETGAALAAGIALAEPTELADGKAYAVVVPQGGHVEVVDRDLDIFRTHPRRKKGTVTVHDADAFIRYMAKHALPESEIWADVKNRSIIGVINAHGAADETATDDEGHGLAGWSDHRVQLVLHSTPAWDAWLAKDRQLMGQVEFSEHIEERLIDIVNPPGADMLELAQTFQATRNAAFQSSHRLSSGQVQLEYREEVDATAGKRGQMQIPERFELALQPFEGSDPYKVNARLRYRLTEGHFSIGYLLERPEDVLRAAFADVQGAIDTHCDSPVFAGKPAA